MSAKKTGVKEIKNGDPAIEILIDGLHKSFDGKHVLRGIDLDIRRNSIVAIVGGSGCGKTVLLNHILGLLEPDQGRVQVSDHDQDGEPLVDLADLDENQMANIHMHWGGGVPEQCPVFGQRLRQHRALAERDQKHGNRGD